MTADIVQHWIEVLGACLIGLGGWLYALGRKYQSLKNDIENLQRDQTRLEARMDADMADLRRQIAAVDEERGKSAAKIYTRLDEIGRNQAAQDAQITHIVATCNRTNQMLMDLLAGRRAGGSRNYDLPPGQQ